MKSLLKLTFLIIVACTPLLSAAEPADSQIKGALSDIERYEKQFAGLTSVNTSTAKRTLKLLGLTKERLDSSTNRDHESWVAATNRYNQLVSFLEQFTTAQTTSTPSSQAPNTSRTSTPSQTNSAPQQMISQYRVRIKKIQRDIESRISTIDQAGPKPFQSPEYVAKFDKSAQMFADSIAKYAPYQNDPDVIAATNSLTTYNNMIAFGKQHAAKEIAELGDVQKILAAIEQRARTISVPETPQEPFIEGQLSQWIIALSNTRKAGAEIYKPLPQIRERAYLPNNSGVVQQGAPYDLNDVDRLQRMLIGVANSIESSVKSTLFQLTNRAQFVGENLAHYSEYDPADPNDQTNHFLGEGSADAVRKQLNASYTNTKEAATFAKLLEDPAHENMLAVANKIQTTLDTYEANLKKAYELVRMPAAATTDSELTKIAQDTLSKYDYVGDIERMVINTEKVHRSEETSEQKFDDVNVSASGTITLSGTETTYFYEWDQFQVATAEPVADKYYIFFNTLKRYTSGDSTTPLNKWIISSRIQSSEIPLENIVK